MKKIALLTLIFGFILISCHKEEITFHQDEKIDPPTTVTGAVYSGKIVSNLGDKITNATVNVYQDGEKLGSLSSDSDGNYSTVELDIKPDSKVTFEITKNQYAGKIRQLAATEGFHTDTDFSLVAGGTNPYTVNSISLTDTNLVKVYGTLTDVNGDPAEGVYCIGLWGHADMNSMKSVLDISDENGYFEFLVEKNEEIFFTSFVSGLSDCYITFNTNDTGSGQYPNAPNGFQHLGFLENDTEFIEVDDVVMHYNNTILKGRLLDCDGNPVTSGWARAKLISISSSGGSTLTVTSEYSTPNFDDEGRFVIYVNSCEADNFTLKFKGINEDNYGVEMVVDFAEGIIDLGDLMACRYYPPFPSQMYINIGDIYSSNGIYLKEQPSPPGEYLYFLGIFVDSSLATIANFFQILDQSLIGEEQSFSMFDFGGEQDWGFDATNEEMKVTITGTDYNDCIEATIHGVVETNGHGTQNVTGSFTLCRD